MLDSFYFLWIHGFLSPFYINASEFTLILCLREAGLVLTGRRAGDSANRNVLEEKQKVPKIVGK